MRVTTTNPALRARYDREIMGEHYDPPGVRFHATGTSQEVVDEVAERMLEEYDDIEPYTGSE
jgi:hypothetical protein